MTIPDIVLVTISILLAVFWLGSTLLRKSRCSGCGGPPTRIRCTGCPTRALQRRPPRAD